MQLSQRRQGHARRAKGHPGAGGRIEHPRGHDDDHAGRRFDVNDLAASGLTETLGSHPPRRHHIGGMRQGITVEVSATDRARLEAIVADRNTPQKHVWRAEIILATAEGLGTNAIMRRAGVSKRCVWRWQARFAAEGVAGLLRDKTRPPGTPPLPNATVERVVELTRQVPPGEVTHWTGRAMAKVVGISLSAVQGIWKAHGLVPHRVRTFKFSKDPEFIAKLRDIVGLYMSPPAHAVVLSVDEKSQIQALDRTQPGLPIKPGQCATMTHDYTRHGTTTLFAALNVLDGTVVGRCMQRHRHQEFLRFLNAVEAAVPAGKLIHAILDNYAVHKHPKVWAWLERHPRWTFHFTPTSCSWLNAVEGFFATLSKRRLKRGSFASLVDLQAAINRYLDEANADPKPFVWTAEPDGIIEKVRRGYQASQSIH
jgi:transposase